MYYTWKCYIEIKHIERKWCSRSDYINSIYCVAFSGTGPWEDLHIEHRKPLSHTQELQMPTLLNVAMYCSTVCSTDVLEFCFWTIVLPYDWESVIALFIEHSWLYSEECFPYLYLIWQFWISKSHMFEWQYEFDRLYMIRSYNHIC